MPAASRMTPSLRHPSLALAKNGTRTFANFAPAAAGRIARGNALKVAQQPTQARQFSVTAGTSARSLLNIRNPSESIKPTPASPLASSTFAISHYRPNVAFINSNNPHASSPMTSWFRNLFTSAPPVNMAEAKDTVQKYIDENAVMVFSKSYCPYCSQTKKLLEQMGVDFNVVELDKRDDGSALQAALQDISGQRTVPNNFIAKKHVGGNSEIQDLNKSGQLKTLVQNAGALKA